MSDPNLITKEESLRINVFGLLSEQDLATLLGHKSLTTLATWRSEGYGPKHVKLGKTVFYRRDDIHAWITERAVARDQVA